MVLPITGIGHLIDFLVLIYFYSRIRKTNIANNKFYYYFERFTLSMATFFLIMAIPNLLFPNDSYILGLGYIIGHIFLYVSYAFLIRVSLFILKPAYNSLLIFFAYLVLAAAITTLNVILFNYPVVLDNGITAFNAAAPIGIAITLISLVTLLPSSVLFIREAIRQPQQRRRFALIGISFLLIIIGGPMHDTATTASMYIVADAITTLGFLTMFFGVIFGSKSALTNRKR